MPNKKKTKQKNQKKQLNVHPSTLSSSKKGCAKAPKASMRALGVKVKVFEINSMPSSGTG